MKSEVRSQESELRPSDFALSELQAWGESFGARLEPGTIVTLQGDLGAGKTTLAQAICRGVGIREDVTSPTFALVNQYQTSGLTLFHLDLYRLRGPEDLTNIGWDDIINSDAIVIVEWPERAQNRLPDETIRIRLEHVSGDPDRRRISVE